MAAKLLCFHPGAYVTGDASFEDDAVAFATSLGFVATSVAYPNCDPRSALWAAIYAAQSAAKDGSKVYAYGDSAGAGLSARLAQKGYVRAACSFAPVVYLDKWVAKHPELTLIDCLRVFTDGHLNTVSPGYHIPTPKPVLVFNGDTDNIVDSASAWAKYDPKVWRIVVSGNHLQGGPAAGPAYGITMQRGITWLAKWAGLVPRTQVLADRSSPLRYGAP